MNQSCRPCTTKPVFSSSSPSFTCYENYQNFNVLQNAKTQTKATGDAEKFKTKLCVHFMTNRKCIYGAKCHFAHGEHELRRTEDSAPLIHPRHKTTLCQNEFLHGTCKYGKGCSFIHRDDPEYNTLREQMVNHKEALKSAQQPQLSNSRDASNQRQGGFNFNHPSSAPVEPIEAPTASTANIVSGLFMPLKQIFHEIQEPTSFVPGTPLTSLKRVSYDDRRTSAASVWGPLSPRVSVWEKSLEKRLDIERQNIHGARVRSPRRAHVCGGM